MIGEHVIKSLFTVSSLSLALAACLLLGVVLSSPVQSKATGKGLEIIKSVLPDSTVVKNNVVYVDFWASWCAPCGQSFPFMNELQEAYGAKGLKIVTINLDKDHEQAQDFLDRLKSPLEVVFDSTGSLAKKYDIDAMPSSFIYGRDGTLRAHHQGFSDKDTVYLDSVVRTLIEEKQPK